MSANSGRNTVFAWHVTGSGTLGAATVAARDVADSHPFIAPGDRTVLGNPPDSYAWHAWATAGPASTGRLPPAGPDEDAEAAGKLGARGAQGLTRPATSCSASRGHAGPLCARMRSPVSLAGADADAAGVIATAHVAGGHLTQGAGGIPCLLPQRWSPQARGGVPAGTGHPRRSS
jgi:hypothetical protein